MIKDVEALVLIQFADRLSGHMPIILGAIMLNGLCDVRQDAEFRDTLTADDIRNLEAAEAFSNLGWLTTDRLSGENLGQAIPNPYVSTVLTVIDEISPYGQGETLELEMLDESGALLDRHTRLKRYHEQHIDPDPEKRAEFQIKSNRAASVWQANKEVEFLGASVGETIRGIKEVVTEVVPDSVGSDHPDGAIAIYSNFKPILDRVGVTAQVPYYASITSDNVTEVFAQAMLDMKRVGQLFDKS